MNTMVREFIGLMRSHIPANEVFKCITRDSMTGSHLGQFRDILVNLTQSFSQDIKMNALSLKVAAFDIQEVTKTRAKVTRKGRRYDSLGDAINDQADITETDLWTTAPAVSNEDDPEFVAEGAPLGLSKSMKLISKLWRPGRLVLKEKKGGNQSFANRSVVMGGGDVSERYPGCLPLEAKFHGEMP
jgi:hypothetical protein